MAGLLHRQALLGGRARLLSPARHGSLWQKYEALKFPRTRLGRVIRDINRKIESRSELEARFGRLLDRIIKVRHRTTASAPQGLFAFPCCIGKGKAMTPYEFAC